MWTRLNGADVAATTFVYCRFILKGLLVAFLPESGCYGCCDVYDSCLHHLDNEA